MARKPLPSTERLRQLLCYDRETGLLTWRSRNPVDFEKNGVTAQRVCSIWNARYAGTCVGFVTSKGYIRIKFEGHTFHAHRVIWKMETGVDPDEVDHINRDKSDNRLENLRDVNHSDNMRNKPLRPDNTSGAKNIFWSPRMKRWVVQLKVPGKGQRQVAWKAALEDAIIARDRLMALYGYNMELDKA